MAPRRKRQPARAAAAAVGSAAPNGTGGAAAALLGLAAAGAGAPPARRAAQRQRTGAGPSSPRVEPDIDEEPATLDERGGDAEEPLGSDDGDANVELQINDVVTVPARQFGSEYAKANFPDTYRTAVVQGWVKAKSTPDGFWLVEFLNITG